MRLAKSIFFFVCLLTCLGTSLAIADSPEVKVEIVATDPQVKAHLGSEDKLYVKIAYDSSIPLRFQALALRNGTPLVVGAIKNLASLHPSGHGEALAWVLYTNATHVDDVMVTVLNQEWKEVARVSAPVDVTWGGDFTKTPRVEADWVKSLSREDRRETDFVYDPAPRRYGLLFDIFFFLNVAAIPAYVLLQLHMLYHYRYRWRELAGIPLIPYFIAGFYTLVGLDIERALLIKFLFRYTFFALIWLIALWLAKRFWQNKLPPPKLYKPPRD